jgi:hypothetical protein
MAVISISKIQVRRGQENQTGLPQLDSGEFGWALDTQKLYIGNGSTDEGAPAVGNTEVITEHTLSNIFNIDTLYTYKGYLGNDTVITGPNGKGSTYRSVRSKIDEYVSIKDFGVVGNNTDNTTQIQQAIDQIFLNSTDYTDPQSRRRLYFPAGQYKINSSLLVPKYATLVGDGPDKTILIITTSSSTLMQTIDSTKLSNNGKFDPNYTYITSAGRPEKIYIEGISFKYDTAEHIGVTSTQPLLQIDCSLDTQIENCKFSGYYTVGIDTSDNNYAGIEVRGQGVITTKNLHINNCIFENTQIAIKSDYDVENVFINDSKFYNLNRGVAFGISLIEGRGPKNARITNNTFENIELQGIYVGKGINVEPTTHISTNNSFYRVGNGSNTDGALDDNFNQTSIIYFGTDGNVSLEDKFNRTYFMNVNGFDGFTYLPTVQGNTYVNSNMTFTATVISTVTATVLTRFPFANSDQTILVKYIRSHPDFSRKGELTINISTATTPNAIVTDRFSFVGNSTYYSDGGIEFAASVDVNINTVKLLYTNTNITFGKLEYQYSYLQ